ncbi:hypothetical protein [Methylobacterium indicum]|uniref:Uncharacterized protein n=1 Tax=Methylobacterium indicum TaxID=1775910 RepID=A0A8H8WSP1_9HYPH|nr:hypothetical protein [Methylobacterium indicum]BCM83580.1 hypothetical protein mvi_20410 [Methylobacterium indicum]
MAGVSIREYARQRKARGLVGGSDAAVRKAIRDGRLHGAVNGDGTIDVAKADSLWLGNTNPALQRDGAAVGDGVLASRGKPAAVRPPPPVDEVEPPAPVDGAGGATPMTANRLKIQTAREMQKYKREEWEFARDRGEWIMKDPHLSHVHAMARAFQDQWKAFVDGNAAEMAAELGLSDRVHDVHRVLDKRVRMMFERMADTRYGGGLA